MRCRANNILKCCVKSYNHFEKLLAVSYGTKHVTVLYPVQLCSQSWPKTNKPDILKKKKTSQNATDALLKVAKTGRKMTIRRKMDFKSGEQLMEHCSDYKGAVAIIPWMALKSSLVTADRYQRVCTQ